MQLLERGGSIKGRVTENIGLERRLCRAGMANPDIAIPGTVSQYVRNERFGEHVRDHKTVTWPYSFLLHNRLDRKKYVDPHMQSVNFIGEIRSLCNSKFHVSNLKPSNHNRIPAAPLGRPTFTLKINRHSFLSRTSIDLT